MTSPDGDFNFFADGHALANSNKENVVTADDFTPTKTNFSKPHKLQRKLFRKKSGKKFRPPIKQINFINDSQDIFSQPSNIQQQQNETFNEGLHSDNEGFQDLTNYIHSDDKGCDNNILPVHRYNDGLLNSADFNSTQNKPEVKVQPIVSHRKQKILIATPPTQVDSLALDFSETSNSQLSECLPNQNNMNDFTIDFNTSSVVQLDTLNDTKNNSKSFEVGVQQMNEQTQDLKREFNALKNSSLCRTSDVPKINDFSNGIFKKVIIENQCNSNILLSNDHSSSTRGSLETLFQEKYNSNENNNVNNDGFSFQAKEYNQIETVPFLPYSTLHQPTSSSNLDHLSVEENCHFSKENPDNIRYSTLRDNATNSQDELESVIDKSSLYHSQNKGLLDISEQRSNTVNNFLCHNTSNAQHIPEVDNSNASGSYLENNLESIVGDMQVEDKESEGEIPVPISKLENFFSTPLIKKAPFIVREIKEEVQSPFPSNSVKNNESSQILNTVDNAILQWCSVSNVFEELEKQIINNIGSHLIDFKVNISVQDIMDYDVILGNQLLQHPIDFFNRFKQICAAYVNSRNGNAQSQISNKNQIISHNQILFSYNITDMPYIDEHTMKSIKCQKSLNGRLLLIPCHVLSLSSKYSYTKSAAYYCSFGCVQDYEELLYLSNNIGNSESDIIRNDLVCQSCGSFLEEDVSKRCLSEKRHCYAKIEGNDEISNKQRSYTQCVKAIVKDSDVDCIHIGGLYWFTCVLQYEKPTGSNSDPQHFSKLVLDVISVEKFSRFMYHSKSYEVALPDFLCALYQDRVSSPWSFVSSLAFCFLDYITQPGSFFLFKYILLLSLIMEGEYEHFQKEQAPLFKNFHIFFMGRDVLMYQRMFMEASTYTTLKASHFYPPINLYGCSLNDGDNNLICGGSLSLALSSVCVIPNLLQLKKSDIEQLNKVCESQSVTIKLPKNESTQISYPFNGALWCCFDSEKEHEPAYEPLIRQFHVVFKESNMDESQMNDQHSNLVSQILSKTTRFSHVISKDDFKEFIKAAQQTQVKMNGNSVNLLKAYYLLYRNAFPSLSSHIDMDLLSSFATAHAKAMFHDQVTLDDAVLSIYLFEQVSYLKSQASLLGIKTLLFFNATDMDLCMGPENDERMFLLKEHIIGYCSSRLPHIFSAK